MDRSVGINGLDPFEDLCEVWSVDRLITHTPDNHAGVIEIHPDVMLVTLHDLLGEEWCLGDGVVVIAEAMTLLVSLGTEVDAVFITQLIPYGIVGIVTGTYGIDIKLLHDLDILDHPFTTDHITTIRIHLMTVHTFYIYGLSVHQQLGIFDLYLTETDLLTDYLGRLGCHLRDGLTPFLGCLHGIDGGNKAIQIWCLSSPSLTVG